MITRSYILATAGHVDHGKSALVKAISGIDPDRLPEEKARGITIDLGFAHAEIPGEPVDGQPNTIRLGIVDVPGHEDFVKNMVAGVGSIDLALLVVAADDGWMPQTEEHLQILTYLGVTRAVVAITKIDLVQSEEAVRQQIREKLTGTPFAQALIIGTSIVSGRGIAELTRAIAALAGKAPPQRDIGKPRLPVDRAFVLHGVGTVVTGTLIGGSLRRGQAVVVQPSGISAKVRSIQTHNCDIDVALAGTRVAINLPDLHVTGKAASAAATISRGDVVTIQEPGTATETIEIAIERTDRLKNARPIKHGTRVRVHHASANLPGRIYLYDRTELFAGAKAFAQLRLESPAFVFAGDRLVIRDWPERQTLAGGLVLNPAAKAEEFRKAGIPEFLAALQSSGEDASAWIAAMAVHTPLIPRQNLLAQSSFAREQVAKALVELSQAKRIVLGAHFVADAKWWQDFRRRAIEAIDAAHAARPHEQGLPIADLRAAIAGRIPSDIDPWEELLAELSGSGFAQSGATIGRDSHRPALPANLSAAGERIRSTLRAHPMDPPSRKDLAPDSASFSALKFLLQSGEAVDISADVVLCRDAYLQAIKTIQQRLTAGGATVSELKQALGSSRRVVVPLLEKLDREGITQRQGDLRVLKQRPSARPSEHGA